ncbi:hypothetical protein VW35_16265 [Devosia soli]|uniref:Outer membrane protein beta-barrel domain-containing protein n=2 Tax=Devosia soli TaxID=361041 RepID=A0A0F5L5M1_9HYPH|nr:hypothetical protein VW35_16265 [Devosia soli]
MASAALPGHAAPRLLNTDPATSDSTAATDETTTGSTQPLRPTYPGTHGVDPDLVLKNDRLRSGVYPAQPVPPEFAVSPESASDTVPLDWSVGLRGTYQNSNGEGSFVARLTPSFTYTHQGSITDLVVTGGAEIAKSANGGGDMPTVTSANIGFSASTPINPETSLKAEGNLSLSQDLPGTPGLSPFVTTPPQVYSGNLDVGLDRQFGRFNLGVGAGIKRVVYGPTARTDTGLTDNSEQNYWAGSANLRLGYPITPILEVFGEGAVERDIFDTATASLGVYPNATNRTLRTGIAADWNDVWSASASVGVGQRVFDATQLGEITAQLYSAEVTYRPDPTIQLTAGLETELTPPGADSAGTARLQHTAFANAQYTVNTWLQLRASAEWSNAELVGTATTEKRLGLGAGADYTLGANTSLNADYGYGNSDTSSGNTQTHQVSLGITLKR